jgi:hypothetical protein
MLLLRQHIDITQINAKTSAESGSAMLTISWDIAVKP